MPPALFRGLFILLFCALSALRSYFRMRAGLWREPPYSRAEPVGLIVARALLGLPLAAGVAAYCFFPGLWPWAYLILPPWLRLAGAALGAAALLLLLQVHRALGAAFTTSPEPRDGQRLVTEGPYAWVRHPMYVAYLLLFLGAFLLSGSWLVGASGLAVIALLMSLRLRCEERLLTARFGEAYERYRRSTGAFLPRRPYPAPERTSTPRSSASG